MAKAARNPQDLTLRNNTARKTEHAALKVRVRELERLPTRVLALERAVAKLLTQSRRTPRRG